ncbi:MAG TPA: hypothetical protein VEI03_14165 [Stellaceae bacterium]|nr:hypothetical protein [Stellaceae bacterium]
MSLPRALLVGALAGVISAFIVYAIEVSRTLFAIPHTDSIDLLFFLIPLMFWPAGHDFFFDVSYMHIPIMSFAYFGLLLRAVLWNGVVYSVFAAAIWTCMSIAKVGLLIPAMGLLVYWIHVIYR